MRAPALGEAATQLPWLCPCAASLLALARAPAAAAWAEVRRDPAAVVLVLRQAARTLGSPAVSFFPAVLRDPAVLQGALTFLDRDGRSSFADWSQPRMHPVYQVGLRYAVTAQRLAELTGRADPENAYVAGLIGPLGWYAACAADPDRAIAGLDGTGPGGVAADREWGIDPAGIARRLARRWRLPRWVGLAAGALGLPVDVAQTLGADPDLFRVIQLAVALVEGQGSGLGTLVGTPLAANAEALDLSARDQDAVVHEASEALAAPAAWTSPASVPLLPDLLRLAAENQRLQDAPALEQLERDQDLLHHALERQRTDQGERLQGQKLEALAEFAAGAAHEINNPLAVISGQAQYLLGHEPDPARQKSLQTIVSQAQRVYQILSELMQFARPARPQRQVVDARILAREVSLALGDLAGQRRVRVVAPEAEHAFHLFVDPQQVRTALECLLRNAIEAAPAEGWAGIRLQPAGGDRLEFVVEDSGGGPAPAQREHLFDPFYSGRPAGRGRGLGLPTAWRLARENAGDVRFDDTPGGPTRFVLSLPWDRHLEAEPTTGPALRLVAEAG